MILNQVIGVTKTAKTEEKSFFFLPKFSKGLLALTLPPLT